jgi:hypothetical protein
LGGRLPDLRESEGVGMAKGSCLCGEVAFELEDPLSEIELCHCRKCRKAYGAPYAATIYCHRSRFRWLRGEARVSTWDAPVEESPPAYRHSFCKACGSPLPLAWFDLPFVEVPVACMDDPLDARPAYRMFESQCIDWSSDTSDLHFYERASPLEVKVVRKLFDRSR